MLSLSRKRKRDRQRCIVERSRYQLLRHYPGKNIENRTIATPLVKIGDTVDIFPLLGQHLLFSNRNFKFNNKHARLRPHREVMVRPDDLRGKTLLICMLSLRVYHIPGGGLPPSTLSLITTLKERDFDFDFDFDVLFVPVDRGPDHFHKCAMNRFIDFFSQIPCLAVPFANKRACDLIHATFFNQLRIDPHFALIDPTGKVLLTSDFKPMRVFNSHGIREVVPSMHEMLQSSVNADKDRVWSFLRKDDEAFAHGIINLNKLLVSPDYPDFLLTNDGNKVSISILEDKVVGLYLCNHNAPSENSRIESIKKIYNEVVLLGYKFEIVQIDFSCHGYFRGNVSRSCQRENVPWLTLPYIHSRCKRLIRLFKRCIERGCRDLGIVPVERDRLVIINPHELNMTEDPFFEQHGVDLMCRFGVEAYPFTQRRVFDMLTKRRSEEIKLRLIFCRGPLLRRRGEGYDLVPVSQLWGKRVLVIFATHSKYNPGKFMPELKSKYVEQKGANVFEVVYVSLDDKASRFDDCTMYMPWLVYPYSWEFARGWVFETCTYYHKVDSDSDSESDSNSDSESDEDIVGKCGAWCGMLSFGEDGEFISRAEFDGCIWALPETEFPFFVPEDFEPHFRGELRIKYGIELIWG